MASGFFDIRDDAAFFGVLQRVLESFERTHAKRPEDLLLLVLGLAHLREWIAPGYKRGATAASEAERFAAALVEDSNYQIVWRLANHAKHQRQQALPEIQTSKHVELWDDRDTPIDSWMDTDAGPASEYEYGDRNLLDVFEAVRRFYQERWFDLPLEQRWS